MSAEETNQRQSIDLLTMLTNGQNVEQSLRRMFMWTIARTDDGAI